MIYFSNEHEFNEVARQQPLTDKCFLIKNYCKNWQLYTMFSFSNIISLFGNDEIFIEKGINCPTREQVTIKEYIEKILSGEKSIGNWSWQPHLVYNDLLEHSFTLPEFITLHSLDQSLIGSLILTPWVLISAPETVTAMHKDMLSVNGIVGQLEGLKEFTLVAPPHNLEEGKFYSRSELEKNQVEFTQVILEPGDFLYFPMNWWHQAKTIQNSITFIHSTVNETNLQCFLNDTILYMPAYLQRLQSNAKKRNYFGRKIKWISNGFRILEG
ncbi:cupin-like domain-containing protein [Bartonella tribocorum]|uniref:JmjC domain-containing protein n=1 Tax=Bartonella tribocorum TaxID=85701 RepID=A0A2M6UTN7_9HYPH|nr:cupin-like domain-containing protein [Bartonella tribocorum]PIT69477.1 hypothetical protein CER18_03400 [Bartonella tribocorum]